MTKAGFIDTVAASTGVTKKDTEFMVDAVMDALADILVKGDSIRFPTLGSFKVGTVAAHDVENHLVGGVVHFPEQRRVRFKASKALRDRMNAV